MRRTWQVGEEHWPIEIKLHGDFRSRRLKNTEDEFRQQIRVFFKSMRELQGAGAEIILITPHFTAISLMNAKSMRTEDIRPYVQFLCEFADKHSLGIADASARWAHLWKEGIPYVTLLFNAFDHPDDRGHLFFVEEIMKNFE